MEANISLGDLKNPADIRRLEQILAELYDLFDPLYETTAPNGAISAPRGKLAIYKNGSTYEQWQNMDGDTLWQRIDYGAYTEPFKTGDWIISSVATARTGWTDKSATYSNKFMRINATPLATGGADTHTHTTPNHTHTYSGTTSGGSDPRDAYNQSGNRCSDQNHTHTYSGTTASEGAGTTGNGDNVPAYISVCVFEKQ